MILGKRKTKLEILERNDQLMELILDISNELDIDVLCHKILLNVGRLTRADRCSLFLARGPRDNRYLEAKLFDVGANTGKCLAGKGGGGLLVQSDPYIKPVL